MTGTTRCAPRVPGRCSCGHPRGTHVHYARHTGCADCPCEAYRPGLLAAVRDALAEVTDLWRRSGRA